MKPASASNLVRLGDSLCLVFSKLSAYDLAFLYFSGNRALQKRICSLATCFDLRYDPYRRLSWPYHFLRLLPALKHVRILGCADNHLPIVSNSDIRALPSGLLTLELGIANGMISLLQPASPTYEVDLDLQMLDVSTLFPNLVELRWRNTLSGYWSHHKVRMSLNIATLRILTMSPITFSSDMLTSLPSTLEELCIISDHWRSNGVWLFPRSLQILQLSSVSIPITSVTWPPALHKLSIVMDNPQCSSCDISQFLETESFPPTLNCLSVFAPAMWLTPPLLAHITDSIEDLRLYFAGIMPQTFVPPHPPLQDIISKPNLRTFHLCFCTEDGQLPSQSIYFADSSPNLVDFVVSTGQTANISIKLANMPLHLTSLRSKPLHEPGTLPPFLRFQALPSSHHPGKIFPNSLLDLEDTLANFRDFPPTLTRLHLQSYFKSPLPEHLDYSTLGDYIPNVCDLTLVTDDAFKIVSCCATLPLISLSIGLYPGKRKIDAESSGFDAKFAADFDLNCFPNLQHLSIDIRAIGASSRQKWFENLPQTLKELSLASIKDLWPIQCPGVFVESWIVFPRLPRSLARFTAFVSDLDIHNVFAMLPNTLTELYLLGSMSVRGVYGVGESQTSFLPAECVTINPVSLYSLPIHLHSVMLPHGSISKVVGIDFFECRPQLASFFYYEARRSDPWNSMPPLYRPPPHPSLLSGPTSPTYLHFNFLSTVVSWQQSVFPETDGTISRKIMDKAVRSSLSHLSESEIRVMEKASKIALKKSIQEAHLYSSEQLAILREKYGDGNEPTSEDSKCIIS